MFFLFNKFLKLCNNTTNLTYYYYNISGIKRFTGSGSATSLSQDKHLIVNDITLY